MIHTYRDPMVAKSSLRFALAVLILTPAVGSVLINLGDDYTWNDFQGAAEFTGICLAAACVMYIVNPIAGSTACSEIRLSEDGTCEFDTKRRVVRLHVNEVQSVRGRRDAEDDRAYFTIRYRGGKVRVTEGMTGFDDFLRHLKRLNPAIDLNFRLDASGGFADTATEGRGSGISHGIGSVLFPLFVIALLVYLASQTLLGK